MLLLNRIVLFLLLLLLLLLIIIVIIIVILLFIIPFWSDKSNLTDISKLNNVLETNHLKNRDKRQEYIKKTN